MTQMTNIYDINYNLIYFKESLSHSNQASKVKTNKKTI